MGSASYTPDSLAGRIASILYIAAKSLCSRCQRQSNTIEKKIKRIFADFKNPLFSRVYWVDSNKKVLTPRGCLCEYTGVDSLMQGGSIMLEAVTSSIAADVPVLLWGAPGTGKTAVVRDLAAKAGAHLEVLVGSILDPVDVSGIPVPDAKGEVHLSPPAWVRRMRAALDSGRDAWLFLDELSCAPSSVQAALLRVVQERHVGDVDITGCRMIAASNRAEHAADGGTLAAATANRWLHLDWQTPTASEWVIGESTGWGRTKPSPSALAVIGLIGGFLTRFPAAILEPPKHGGSDAWPSPRSWSALVRVLTEAGGVTSPVAPMLANGLVGPGRGGEFFAWASAQDLPDPESVLAGATLKNLRPDQMGATLVAVATAATAEHPARKKRIARAAEVLGGVRPDVAIPAAKILCAGSPESSDLPEIRALLSRLRVAL